MRVSIPASSVLCLATLKSCDTTKQSVCGRLYIYIYTYIYMSTKSHPTCWQGLQYAIYFFCREIRLLPAKKYVRKQMIIIE